MILLSYELLIYFNIIYVIFYILIYFNKAGNSGTIRAPSDLKVITSATSVYIFTHPNKGKKKKKSKYLV